MRILKITNILSNPGSISTCISPVTGNLLPPETVHSCHFHLSLLSLSFRLFSYIFTLTYPNSFHKAIKQSKSFFLMTALSCPQGALMYQVVYGMSLRKLKELSTLCAEALEHFRSYLIFHKDEYLSSDYI